MSKKKNSTKPEVVPHENPLVAISDDENLPVLSNPALHRYLQEISQYELLTREETEERFSSIDINDHSWTNCV